MTLQQHLREAVPTNTVGTALRPARFTGSWPSAAAWGAGLVQLALGAGAIVSGDSSAAARAVGVLVALLGAATFIWGCAGLATSRLVAPRAALTGVLVGVLALVALLILAPARASVFAVAIGTVLLIAVGAFSAAAVRRGARARDAGSGRGIAGMLLAAAIISALVTPALGATQDGYMLRDDGTVPVVTHDGH